MKIFVCCAVHKAFTILLIFCALNSKKARDNIATVSLSPTSTLLFLCINSLAKPLFPCHPHGASHFISFFLNLLFVYTIHLFTGTRMDAAALRILILRSDFDEGEVESLQMVGKQKGNRNMCLEEERASAYV